MPLQQYCSTVFDSKLNRPRVWYHPDKNQNLQTNKSIIWYIYIYVCIWTYTFILSINWEQKYIASWGATNTHSCKDLNIKLKHRQKYPYKRFITPSKGIAKGTNQTQSCRHSYCYVANCFVAFCIWGCSEVCFISSLVSLYPMQYFGQSNDARKYSQWLRICLILGCEVEIQI